MQDFRGVRAGLAVGLGVVLALGAVACGGAEAQGSRQVEVWRTNADRSELLKHVQGQEAGAAEAGAARIVVDPAKVLQGVDGFGFAMTGGSAQLLHRMSAAKRHALLEEIFGKGPGDLGVSYLRVSVGASDMNDHVFTYDDVPAGEKDVALSRFSLAEDEADLIPVMKEVLGIAPGLQVLASPWTAPSWMKTNDAAKGGSLRPEFYGVYADYLVRYLEGMRSHVVPISALTMQNEPLNPKNTPSMVMEAPEEETFLRDALGPALRKAGLKTKVILFDHNCNHPEYATSILSDARAAQYADGSGFHLYEGDISAMSQVHEAFPAKNLYFTEQMVVEHTQDGVLEPVARPVAHVLIGAMRNWSRTVLLWNLAADAKFGPHTNDGGCPVCQGAVTIDGDEVSRNIALYTVAHASKFVPAGSVRIDSTQEDAELKNVAWRTPQGKFVLLVTNTGSAKKNFVIAMKSWTYATALEPGSVATYVW